MRSTLGGKYVQNNPESQSSRHEVDHVPILSACAPLVQELRKLSAQGHASGGVQQTKARRGVASELGSPAAPPPPALQGRGRGSGCFAGCWGLITQRDWDPPKLSPWASASLKPSCCPVSQRRKRSQSESPTPIPQGSPGLEQKAKPDRSPGFSQQLWLC